MVFSWVPRFHEWLGLANGEEDPGCQRTLDFSIAMELAADVRGDRSYRGRDRCEDGDRALAGLLDSYALELSDSHQP